MRRSAIVPLIATLSLIVAGCGGLPRPSSASNRAHSAPPRPAPVADDATPVDDPIAVALLEHHNRLRAEADLPPLARSAELAEAARSHASGMIALGEISHDGPDGSKPADRVRRQGYRYASVGENVASGQETVEEVMGGWMNSPGHRKNILGDFEQIGTARVEDDEGRPYWCVVFATPLPQLDPDRAAADLIALINEDRAGESLPPLESDDVLGKVALDHSRAMAEARSLDPPGASVGDAINAAGIGYRRLSSGVASGPSSPSAALETLSKDGGRRRDVLGAFDRIGVGYANDDEGRPYWSVIFLKEPGR